MWRRVRLSGLLFVAAALIVVPSAQGALTLRERVLGLGELSGFGINGPAEIARSAEAWYRPKLSGRFKDTAALRARGFVVGAREYLTGSNAQAVSGVMEFKTARGARTTLARSISDLRAGAYALKRFSVPGIPGARAAATSAATRNAFNIAFVDGRFWYLVSVGYPPNAKKPPPRTSVIAAARSLYRRVHSQ
jgi:hypothetical protein